MKDFAVRSNGTLHLEMPKIFISCVLGFKQRIAEADRDPVNLVFRSMCRSMVS